MKREASGDMPCFAARHPDAGASIRLDCFAPPADLAPYIANHFLLRCEEARITEIQPAGNAIFAVFLRGRGNVTFDGGAIDPSHRANVLTPQSAAASIAIEGPWHVFGATLTPLGWAALTGGLSASAHGNRLVEAGELLGAPVRDLATHVTQGYHAGDLDGAAMAALSCAALAARLAPIRPMHARLIRSVSEWLDSAVSPRVEDLNASALYSPRQLQRLVDHYFGLPPKQLARKHRALRAAAVLGNPAATPDELAAMADEFYDHPNMIREIRLFAGRAAMRVSEAGPRVRPILSDQRHSGGFIPASPRRMAG